VTFINQNKAIFNFYTGAYSFEECLVREKLSPITTYDLSSMGMQNKTLLISLLEQTFGNQSARICWLKFVLMDLSDDNDDAVPTSELLCYIPNHYGKLLSSGIEWIDLYAVRL
jgi:hypothetical protein